MLTLAMVILLVCVAFGLGWLAGYYAWFRRNWRLHD